MAGDLVAAYCKRSENSFSTDCNHLIPPEVCRLLQECPLKEIFAQGRRCRPDEILTSIVRRKLKRYQDVVRPEDHLDAVTFELQKSLEGRQLTEVPTLYGLVGYFDRPALHAVIRLLEQEGVFTVRTCDQCMHLSRSKPFSCQLQYITVLEEQGERKIAHAWYNQKRRPSDSACKDGFQGYIFEPITPTSAPALQPAQDPSWEECIERLQERVARAEKSSKKKQIYQRQLAIFTALIHLYAQGFSKKEATDDIVKTLNISPKMFRHDLSGILQFLSEKMGKK